MTNTGPEATTPGAASPADIVRSIYGTGRRGRPNTRAAAAALGVSQRSVQRWIKAGRLPTGSTAGQQLADQHTRQYPPEPATPARTPTAGTAIEAPASPSRLWTALSRARPTTSVAAMITAMYGATSRGKPRTAEAARHLGVSQRAVQRWIKAGRLPTGSTAGQQLAHDHQQWQHSPAGRRAQLGGRREARLRNHGTSMVFLGKIAISNDPRNSTTRSTTVDINAEAMNQILDAGLAGDDTGAHTALEGAFGQAFGGSVSLTIDGLSTYR